MYMPFAMIFNVIFLVLTNFCLIFGITITMIYLAKSEERQRSLDNQRHKLRLRYTISLVISILVFIACMAQYWQPRYCIPMWYNLIENIDHEIVEYFKVFCYIIDGTLFLAWIVASS